MLRQIECGVQNGSITENWVLPVTTLFLRKFYFTLRTSYKELIWCTNHANVHIHTFRKRWSFVWSCFFPASILKHFAIFTGKHLCQSLFFNKVESLRPATLYKRRLWHSCCPVNFAKFVRTSFFAEHRFLKTLKSRKILICFILIICSYLLMKYIMYMALNNTFFFFNFSEDFSLLSYYSYLLLIK